MEAPDQRATGDRRLIPRAYIQAWSAKAPWPDLRQVEQDLIICRALCDLFSASDLRDRIAFRGGTAIHKLLFRQPLRYSEDIDLVQTRAEPIGETVDAIREALSWLGKCSRLAKGKDRLDNALESLQLLCEPVEPPRGDLEHIHYFCRNTEIPSDLKEREPQRTALYLAIVVLLRAYANIADELEPAGYSAASVDRIKRQLDHYLKLREVIRLASNETLDLKAYEADMRHLIDTYIAARATTSGENAICSRLSKQMRRRRLNCIPAGYSCKSGRMCPRLRADRSSISGIEMSSSRQRR